MTRPELAALRARLAPLARLASAFDARSQRERVLLIAATAGVLVALALPARLDPLWLRLQQLGLQRDTLATALQQLQAETESHQAQHQLTREQAAAELEALRQRHAAEASTALPAGSITASTAGSTPLAAATGIGGLVGPDQMLPLLSQLLGRHSGLRVRALQSLGHTPWPEGAAGSPATTANTPTPPTPSAAARSATAAAPAANKAAPAADPSPDTPRLYRHAVELQVEGSYADLLAYLRTLEALPHKLLWGALTLQVEQHPRVLLTLRLYTLSPRASWVEL